MDRVFQNDNGEIDELVGVSFSKAVSLDDIDTGNVVFIWLNDSTSGNWYRVFIDGFYCGIDKYKTDKIVEDIDDHIRLVDISSEFRNKTVIKAIVTNNIKGKGSIQFELRFNESSFALICKNEDGYCARAFG